MLLWLAVKEFAVDPPDQVGESFRHPPNAVGILGGSQEPDDSYRKLEMK